MLVSIASSIVGKFSLTVTFPAEMPNPKCNLCKIFMPFVEWDSHLSCPNCRECNFQTCTLCQPFSQQQWEDIVWIAGRLKRKPPRKKPLERGIRQVRSVVRVAPGSPVLVRVEPTSLSAETQQVREPQIPGKPTNPSTPLREVGGRTTLSWVVGLRLRIDRRKGLLS